MGKLKHEERLQGVNIKLCDVVRKAAKDADFDITISEGLRSKERQAQLVKEGKSKTMNSNHIVGKAVDLYPLDAAGQIDWKLFDDLATHIKTAAKELNVSVGWGGDWKTFIDKPHFELV